MATARTLISAKEVKHYGGLDDSYPSCELRLIRRVERHEFNTCLGKAFKKVLEDDLLDPTYQAYDPAQSTPAGEHRSYKGTIYTAKSATTELPTNTQYWDVTKKFETDCYNDLWCEGSLAEYLAYCVKKDMLPGTLAKETNSGLVQMKGRSFQPAKDSHYAIKARAIDRDISKIFQVLDDWIRDNNENGCFDKYKGLAIDCCGDCGEDKDDCSCEDCKPAKRSKTTWKIG